jgi:dolichol-phosphate mannosyltransferase
MLHAIEGGTDLVIGSRYIEGGSIGDWVTDRRIISRAGTLLARNLSRAPVTDPLSGFFLLRANLFRQVRPLLKPSGFKILLEILSHVPPTTRIAEVPLIFRMRLHGQSKLSVRVHFQFLFQILRLVFERLLRIGPFLFAIVTIVVALVLLPRALALRLLYTDASLRARAQSTLENVALHEGWLLSDIELLSVSSGSLSIVHRDHVRTPQPSLRCTIALQTSRLTCDAPSL